VTHRRIAGECDLDIKEQNTLTVVQEDIARWIQNAEIARALVNIVARLDVGQSPDIAQFKLLPGWVGGDNPPSDPWAPVTVLINRWLLMCRFDFEFGRRGRPKPVQIGTPALFAHIGFQLALTISRIGGLAVCSFCGRSYSPKRKPNPNRENYCSICGLRASWRMAQRRRKSRVATMSTCGAGAAASDAPPRRS
jgi:hypothetical protein